jgi:hypothetical protein
MASVTWECPNCKRRVPNRAAVCHCGTTREQAELSARPKVAAPAPSPPPARGHALRPAWSSLTWDLKALVIAFGLVLILGAAFLFVPFHPTRVQPVLGYADHLPPKPSPSPTTPVKHWKLPWSR